MPEPAHDISDANLTGYRQLEKLKADTTLLCCDISGNVVVLKRLEDDCLHRNQLHPAIKDRLRHVRELAHPHLAVLRTVERYSGSPCLVWTYLDGETFDHAIATPSCKVASVCGQLASAVDALHEMGIFHGSIHAGNVIVRPNGQVWLTDISPYLYADPRADIAGVAAMLRTASRHFSTDPAERILHLIHQLEHGEMGLRETAHLLQRVETEPIDTVETTPASKPGYRFSSIFLASGVAVSGRRRGCSSTVICPPLHQQPLRFLHWFERTTSIGVSPMIPLPEYQMRGPKAGGAWWSSPVGL